MPVNSSSNISLLSPLLCYSNSSLYPHVFACFEKPISFLIYITFSLTSILLLLPLHVLVLWMGFQRWRYQCSVPSGTTSHSDIFTYNMVTVEIISILGSVFHCCASYRCSPMLMTLGYYLFFITYPLQTFLHCLTCVERYLAVVHPITYLGLRKAGGVKIRNISIGGIWLLSFGLLGSTALYFPEFPSAVFFAAHGVVIIVVCFCSLSVLHVMIRLGLRKVGGCKERIDQSKQRAFYTILAITVTLVLRSCGLGVSNIIFTLEESQSDGCVLVMSAIWFCLPSSLVPTLLFLHRAGKLACFSHNLSKRHT